MKVYEYKVKIKLKNDLQYYELPDKLSYFIDSTLGENEEFLKYHGNSHYKGYVHDFLYPIESNGIYQKNKIYTMRIRMIEEKLVQYLMGKLAFHETNEFIAIGGEIKIIPKRNIQQLYSITPVIL